jgi:hypothetical protein
MSIAAQNWLRGFYWIGVLATVTCLGLVLAGNTELIWRFEHRALPLSWIVAGAAVVSFLVAELVCVLASPAETESRRSQPAPELEAAEA